MSTGRVLAVTIDTEVDKDPRWRVSSPPTWEGLLRAVPDMFTPLFEEFGVVPTYLLSPEVIEEPRCAEVLAGLGERAELGTHLHAEFVEPDRILHPATMAGRPTDMLQSDLQPAVEARKLAALTDLFERTFGARPTSFRAGRFGMGPSTLEALARLGYVVDSSVTPGIRWRYGGGRLDYRNWAPGVHEVQTPAGRIIEIPLSIRGGGRVTTFLDGRRDIASRAAARALGGRGRFHWLRPSWGTGADLVRYVEESVEPVLVMMLHNVDVVPGASPYAATRADTERILGAMREVFAHCERSGIAFCGLTEAAR